ncbi:MAG TPA: ATP-binding protein [Longimicrobiaceae bacterium]
MGATVLDAVTVLDVLLLLLSLPLGLGLHQAAMALDDRLARTSGVARAGWLAVSVVLLGLGLWLLGLATLLPFRESIPVEYAVLPALLALALALSSVAFSFIALHLHRPAWLRVSLGAALWGASVAVIHYLGLAALGWPNAVRADPPFAIQVAAATIAGAAVLLWTALAERELRPRRRWWRMAGNAVALVAAPAAAYSGLVATKRTPVTPPTTRLHFLVDPVAVLVGGAVLLLLVAAVLLAASVDRSLRRRRAETEALRRSDDRFRSLIQASSQIVWTTDPNGEMVSEQTSWSEFTGQNLEAYRGWGWFNAIHPEDREATASVWQAALANRRPLEVQHRVRRHDGQYRACVARVVPVLEPDGQVREWVGTHTDVTEHARMQEERELLASAGRVLSSSLDERDTLNAIATLLVPRLADWCSVDIRTSDGSTERVVATHADPQRTTLLREVRIHPSAEREGHGAARVLATGESELFREVNDELLRSIVNDDADFQRLREVGVTSLLTVPLTARRQVLGVLTLALSEQGEPYDLRDLALAEELARRAAIAIDNARLYSAARAAIQARDEMMSVVSHDLRNPLSTVMMTAELLLDGRTDPEEQRRHLQTIGRAAGSMNRLIRDLLDAGQLDQGSLAIERRPLEPGPLAEEACESMQPMAKDKGQRLTCEIEAQLPKVEGDAERMGQVLSNLLGNAIKFGQEGGSIHLRVASRREEIVFSIIDDGPGIAPEDLPRVFDRHWRGKETAHLGAGLGLAISKAIVEAHGGRIWVESEPGRGTAFHFTIPTLKPESEPEARTGSEAAEDELEHHSTDNPGYDVVSGRS